MRACPVCESEMSPRFASECEPPIAWGCPECGLFQLESGGRPFTAEEEAALASQGFTSPRSVARPRHRRERAATQAREVLEVFGADTPVDVEALAERLGYPVRWRTLRRDQRGGIEGDSDHRILVLNRDYPFRSDGERRWAVAEELAHAVLGHTALVASDEPGRAGMISEPARIAQERDAKAFAAELLMPAGAVRRAFERAQNVILRALAAEERAQATRAVVADLAREFHVSQQAMRLRLAELELLS
jgi:IrrE N-terminal-like domain